MTRRSAAAPSRIWRGALLPAVAIREASAAGASDAELAAQYGADRTTRSAWQRFVCWLLGHDDVVVGLGWSGFVQCTCRRCNRVAREDWSGGPRR